MEKALSHQLYLLLICTGKLDKTNTAFDKGQRTFTTGINYHALSGQG